MIALHYLTAIVDSVEADEQFSVADLGASPAELGIGAKEDYRPHFINHDACPEMDLSNTYS